MSCQLEFPDPSRDAEALTDLRRYLVDFRNPVKILPHFQENVAPLIDPEKRKQTIASLQAVIAEDRNASERFAEVFEEEMGMTAGEFAHCQSFDFARTLAGLFLYTALIGNNRDGRDTFVEISQPSFWYNLHPGFMVIDSRGGILDDVRELLGVDVYFERMRARYGTVRTILPGRTNFPFDSIFVCSDIETPRRGNEPSRRISNATLTSLRRIGPRLILNALGGNGKSMMLGKQGDMLWRYANGIDEDPVRLFGTEEEIKSVSRGRTFKRDLVTEDEVRTGGGVLVDEVARTLRRHNIKGEVVSVQIRRPDMSVMSRQKTLPHYMRCDREGADPQDGVLIVVPPTNEVGRADYILVSPINETRWKYMDEDVAALVLSAL